MAENDKKSEKSVQRVTDNKTSALKSDQKTKLLLIGGGAVLGALLVALVALAAFGVKNAKQHDDGYEMRGGHNRGGMMMGHGNHGMRGDKMRGGSYGSNTMVHGTATEVSDTQITVVGNGVSKKITVNTSTTYGDKKPSVNDSVMIRGTTSGDTFTATSVQVVNR